MMMENEMETTIKHLPSFGHGASKTERFKEMSRFGIQCSHGNVIESLHNNPYTACMGFPRILL